MWFYQLKMSIIPVAPQDKTADIRKTKELDF